MIVHIIQFCHYLAKISLTNFWISILLLCPYSTLLHHTVLRLPMDPFCLFLLWRKGWRQRKQVLGKNAPFLDKASWPCLEAILRNSNFIQGINVRLTYMLMQKCTDVISVNFPVNLRQHEPLFLHIFYMTNNKSKCPSFYFYIRFPFTFKCLWMLHDSSQYTHINSGFIRTLHDRLCVCSVILH